MLQDLEQRVVGTILEEHPAPDGTTKIIEDIIKENSNSYSRDTTGWRYKLTDYTASATGGLTVFTPPMIINEIMAGMDTSEIFAARSVAVAATVPGMICYQKIRAGLAKFFSVDESEWVKKHMINALSYICHPPIYSLTLLASGAGWDEINKAVPVGLLLVMGTSPVVGPFIEWWRTKVWKMQKTYGDYMEKAYDYAQETPIQAIRDVRDLSTKALGKLEDAAANYRPRGLNSNP